jgi:hypothetical protein
MKVYDIIKEDAFQDFLGGLVGTRSAPADTSTSSTSGDATSGNIDYKSSPGQIDPNEIKKYLISKGFDNNQAAGWLVNIKWESHFKPGAYISSDAGQGQSGGFFGFHDVKNGHGLFTKMVAYTGGGNNWQTNWKGQLDFAMQDSRGQQYKSTKFSNPGEAASWWVKNYEKPANTSYQASARARDAIHYA